MSVSVCECVLCLLPSLLLLLLSLGLRWPTAQLWLWLTARAGAWRLWLAVCWLLELPQLNIAAEGAWDDGGPVGTTCDRSGPEQSSTPRQHWPRRGVACQPTALAQHLFQHCGSLALPKLAAWPRGDPHVQTLRGLLWGSCCDGEQSPVQFSREHLLMRDGGTVALDWAVEAAGRESRAEAKREREHQPAGTKALGCFTSTPPVLILVPQFWGGLTPHLKELCHLALCQGFYAVVFHPRGTAGCPLTTPRLTEFGDPTDLEQAVAYVRNCHPSSVLVAVSEGSGSGVLLSYLGECGSASHLTAAATISPVLRGQLWFQTPMPPVYRWGALIHRKLQFSRYATSFSAAVDVDRILRSSSLRDYEEALFCSSTSTQPRQTTPRPPTPGPPTGSPGPPTGSPGPPTGSPGPPTCSPGPPTGSPGPPTGSPGPPTGSPGPPTGSPGPPTGSPGPPTGSPGPPSGRRSGVTSPPRGVTTGPSEVWALGERAYPAKDWDGYWERNEPLRDADEVAVPVLCIRSRDDPLLPPASTTPLPLFHSNPYFLLVTTETGGHCGFARDEWGGTQGGPEKATTRNWSHAAILEYFRLVADFLKEERRGGVRGHGGQGRSRPGTVLPPRRRRGNVVRRTRTQTQQIFEEEESGEFTWRRSYTR